MNDLSYWVSMFLLVAAALAVALSNYRKLNSDEKGDDAGERGTFEGI